MLVYFLLGTALSITLYDLCRKYVWKRELNKDLFYSTVLLVMISVFFEQNSIQSSMSLLIVLVGSFYGYSVVFKKE
ncbi:hypothetical protein J2T56_003133 [Natronobacillus azotifigens]